MCTACVWNTSLRKSSSSLLLTIERLDARCYALTMVSPLAHDHEFVKNLSDTVRTSVARASAAIACCFSCRARVPKPTDSPKNPAFTMTISDIFYPGHNGKVLKPKSRTMTLGWAGVKETRNRKEAQRRSGRQPKLDKNRTFKKNTQFSPPPLFSKRTSGLTGTIKKASLTRI